MNLKENTFFLENRQLNPSRHLKTKIAQLISMPNQCKGAQPFFFHQITTKD